ncbi:PQQ-dependent sugar dehydrogenase [Streptomyces sp. WMMC500]|uniref:PQQ-dependent sugar dehydrogenase n=1 Tax=Streptomyces sp. WMMC500 TaxID=3015154 RepID=UPI00248CD48A|nr:PQQ-dependent sugar dehydrogenase [Streptomyces sp. WMMC500]WBB58839.1 PQQ-dependent sugar dehydrogenase [Streptomyces sp. WMMC500]
MSRGKLSAVVALGLALTLSAGMAPAAASASPAETRQVRVALTKVATAAAPTAGAVGPDGSVWIGERAGAVRVLDDQGLSEPVVDITGETTTDGERGIADIAFNPDFTRFYLSYTDIDGHSTVDEFDVVDGEVREDTRRTVLFQEQPGPAHNSGHIAFGPDGMFYISLGDGDFSLEGDPYDNGQNLGTLLGKVLRIDLDAGDPYGIPPDNPFVDVPGARGEIWAYGLRNPWQFSFDAANGDMWLGDVGHLEREEINLAPAGVGGQNYGWPLMEATRPHRGTEPADHSPPVHEWQHGLSGVCDSVTAGFAYRGDDIPDLQGSFVFADYCSGDLQALETQNGQVTEVLDLGANAGWVSTFVQGLDNELYVFDMGGFGGGGGTPSGSVYRIGPA